MIDIEDDISREAVNEDEVRTNKNEIKEKDENVISEAKEKLDEAKEEMKEAKKKLYNLLDMLEEENISSNYDENKEEKQ